MNAKEIAAAIRADLKAAGIKASVRINRYANGQSIWIGLKDHARYDAAQAIAQRRQEVEISKFDGDIVAGPWNTYVHVGRV